MPRSSAVRKPYRLPAGCLWLTHSRVDGRLTTEGLIEEVAVGRFHLYMQRPDIYDSAALIAPGGGVIAHFRLWGPERRKVVVADA